jgi:hypothetical protein
MLTPKRITWVISYGRWAGDAKCGKEHLAIEIEKDKFITLCGVHKNYPAFNFGSNFKTFGEDEVRDCQTCKKGLQKFQIPA